MKNKILISLIISLIISAFIGIIIIMFGSWNDLETKIFLTALTIFLISIPSLCCSTIYEKKNLNLFSKIGICICLLSSIITIFSIWCSIPNLFEEYMWKIILSMYILAFSFAHISLILLMIMKKKIMIIIRKVTILLYAFLDVIYLIAIWFDGKYINQKLILILIILVGLGTIMLPILNKLYKNDGKQN